MRNELVSSSLDFTKMSWIYPSAEHWRVYSPKNDLSNLWMTDTWGVYCPIPPKPGNLMISHWLTVKGRTNQDAISVFNVCTLLSSSVLRSSMAETPHFISWWGRRKGRLRWWWLTPHGNRTDRERERDSRIIASNIKRASVFPCFS